jgi:hypothetical protein
VESAITVQLGSAFGVAVDGVEEGLPHQRFLRKVLLVPRHGFADIVARDDVGIGMLLLIEFGPSGFSGARDGGEQYEGRHNVLYDNFWRVSFP